MMTAARALTIAGSDSGGGAGIQADLKTFVANGCYGMSVLAALTAQNTLGVQGVLDVPPEFVAAQIDSVLSDIGCDAAKTGMLSRPAVIVAVADALRRHRVRRLVVDPVMVSKSGHRLLAEDAVDALRTELLPLATIATPNLEEAAVLLGWRAGSVEEMERAVRELHALGPRAVLLKGGHLHGSDRSPDVFFDGERLEVLHAERLDAKHTHGTGCTLSAAIAAHLARGAEPLAAVSAAKRWLHEAMRHAYPIGGGIGPVHHAWELWPR